MPAVGNLAMKSTDGAPASGQKRTLREGRRAVIRLALAPALRFRNIAVRGMTANRCHRNPASANAYVGEIGGCVSKAPPISLEPDIFSRIFSIAWTGSSPFGQTSAQFMIVRQRNNR